MRLVQSPRLGMTVALASLALLAGTVDASADTNKTIWGPVTTPNGASSFPIYRELGVKVFQYQLRWDRVAPTRPASPTDRNDPAYRWPADVNRAVTQAAASGIEVALMVKGSPPWANGGRPQTWVPSARAYARFLVAATRRYPSVQHWMIWGESSYHGNFQPMPPNKRTGPRAYARLLDKAYVTLKRQSPRNVVIGGCTFTSGDVPPVLFARWMRVDGRPARLDWFAHNPFSFRFPKLSDPPNSTSPYVVDMSDVDTFYGELKGIYGRFAERYERSGSPALRRYFRRFRHRGPRLWLSEFTVSSDRANRAFDFHVSRSSQARWLTRAYRIAAREHYIAGLGWFNLRDEPTSMPLGLTTGLMTYEGVRKPAFYAYKRVR
jgi:hypothetical protein